MKDKDHQLQPLNRVTAICNNSHNEILFLRIQEPEKRETLCLPGDLVRYGELIEETLRQSILRQTTLCVEPIDILGIYSNFDSLNGTHIIESVFVCIITNYPEKGLQLGSNQYVWMNREQIDENMTGINVFKIVKDYYSWRNQKSTYWNTKI
ncbi:NUDIX domain-containing protein [Candidatus Nitrosocosmicus arcticus]|uniref:Putative NUDIX hydrolase n=1 Tax=Candidatus Nitrosocosmicus arcticus TaxID=2035267 RepID=A0A557SYD6_9ARCH|nr:NUDIX hydrolase [Candidatus Nitrosocosmicus arcticus]TVP41617.1 putative NUDIX hydrolase [Candidatus Nitrosocosmicus arcticus]